MNEKLRRFHWLLSVQFGLDLLRFARAIAALPKFFSDLSRYRKLSAAGERIELLPCLHDATEESGAIKGEYFWQDLFVAQQIYRRNPVRHVDIGSRIDGFVAHVASYRQVEVVDVRPLSIDNPNIRFRQVDLTDGAASESISADSVSCLHALEHFGLGRYGDPLRSNGHLLGLANLGKLVAAGGTLYLSMPVGRPRVMFNANRISDPREVVGAAAGLGLSLRSLHWFDEARHAIRDAEDLNGTLEWMCGQKYVLGIFVFARD